MSRGIAGAIAVIMTAAVVGIGCAEEMIGAPCTPECGRSGTLRFVAPSVAVSVLRQGDLMALRAINNSLTEY